MGGHLDLRNTLIAKLPRGLKIRGNLYLRGSLVANIYEMPTKVGVLFDYSGTGLAQLPHGLVAGGCDSLECICFNQVSHLLPFPLPTGKSRAGVLLDFNGNGITHQFPGLIFGGDIYLSGTLMDRLPADLEVSGKVYR